MPEVIAVLEAIVYAAGDVALYVTGSAEIAEIVEVAALAAEVAVTVGAVAGIATELKGPAPEALRQTVRQNLPPRRRGVGQGRVGGSYLLDYGVANTLRQVVAFLDGPVEITNYYLSQDEVRIGTVNGYTSAVLELPGGAYGIYNGAPSVQLDFTFGQEGVPAFPFFNSIIPQAWPSTCSCTGIFVGALRAQGGNEQTFQKRFIRGSPKLNIAGFLGVHYDWRDPDQSRTDPSTWVNTSNPIVGLVHELWNFHDYDWVRDVEPALDVLTAEADICDEGVEYLNVLAKVVVFTAAGNPSVDIAATAPTPPNGTTLYLGGQQVTVTGTTPMTIDGIACKQVSFSGGPLAADSTVGSLVRWQNSPSHPQTEPRYACGGAYNADEREADVAKRFLDAMDGFYTRRGSDGALIVRCGHYYDPTVWFGPDEVISYTWQPFIEAGKSVNQIVPAFVCPALDYNQVDTAPFQDQAEIDIVGLASEPFAPDFVQSNGQVERLAKRRLHRRGAHIETIVLKASGIRAIGERFIGLALGDDEVTELSNQVVEIVGDIEIVDGGMAVSLQVQVADPLIDEWDPYTDEGNGPDATNVQALDDLPAPTIAAVNTFTQGPGGGATGSGVRLAVSIEPPAVVAAATDLTWLVQWMVTGGNSWQTSNAFGLPPGDVEVDTGFVPTDTSIDVQAAYVTGGGRISDWSATFTIAASPSGPDSTDGALDFSINGNPLLRFI